MPPQQDASVEARWQVEYEFWHKIISEEVDRLRFNDGYEPLTVDLYPVKKNSRNEPDFQGKTKIGRRVFRAAGFKALDAKGKEIITITCSPE